MEKLDTTETTQVRYSGSFGSTPSETRTMKITAWICDERKRGGFEIYDTETSGDEYYGSGGIWLDDNGHITDYDGTGMIDLRILAWLGELGHVTHDNKDFFRKELDKYNKEE